MLSCLIIRCLELDRLYLEIVSYHLCQVLVMMD
jgi:hypothetical protein